MKDSYGILRPKNLSGNWSSACINKRINDFFFPLGKAYYLIIPLLGLISSLGSDSLNLSSCKYQTVWIFISLWGEWREKTVLLVMWLQWWWSSQDTRCLQISCSFSGWSPDSWKGVVWLRKHDSDFIPGKKELEKKINHFFELFDYALKRMGYTLQFFLVDMNRARVEEVLHSVAKGLTLLEALSKWREERTAHRHFRLVPGVP